MSKFPELTDTQREPLFALVRYQREKEEEQCFEWDRRFPFGIRPKGQVTPVIAEANHAVLSLWRVQGYMQPGATTTTTVDWILCQKALDYEDRMSKHRFHRWLLGVLDDWATDLRSLIVAVVGTILTALVLNWFGLLG